MKILLGLVISSALGLGIIWLNLQQWQDLKVAHVNEWRRLNDERESLLVDVRKIDSAIEDLSSTDWGAVIKHGVLGFICGYIEDPDCLRQEMGDAQREGAQHAAEAEQKIAFLRSKREEILTKIGPRLGTLTDALHTQELKIDNDNVEIAKWDRLRTIDLWVLGPCAGILVIGFIAARGYR